MLSREQIAFYNDHGYLHIPQVFNAGEINELSGELDRLVREWAVTDQGWTGPWRRAYMDPEVEAKSKLTAMHDLQFYSAAWLRAVTHAKLCEAMSDLLGPIVELHHSTLHIKPPSTGHPFPMHQDHPFYMHENGATSMFWFTWMTPGTKMAKFAFWITRTSWVHWSTSQ